MNNLYTIGKGFAIFTGITLFMHSRYMPTTFTQYMNQDNLFTNCQQFSIKSDEDDMMPLENFQKLSYFITSDKGQ